MIMRFKVDITAKYKGVTGFQVKVHLTTKIVDNGHVCYLSSNGVLYYPKEIEIIEQRFTNTDEAYYYWVNNEFDLKALGTRWANDPEKVKEFVIKFGDFAKDRYLQQSSFLKHEIGPKLQEHIKKKGLKQKDLADKIGISSTAMSQALKGQFNFSDKHLNKLCHLLGVELKFVIIEQNDYNKHEERDSK